MCFFLLFLLLSLSFLLFHFFFSCSYFIFLFCIFFFFFLFREGESLSLSLCLGTNENRSGNRIFHRSEIYLARYDHGAWGAGSSVLLGAVCVCVYIYYIKLLVCNKIRNNFKSFSINVTQMLPIFFTINYTYCYFSVPFNYYLFKFYFFVIYFTRKNK